jgi:hypothetical protein
VFSGDASPKPDRSLIVHSQNSVSPLSSGKHDLTRVE